VEAVSVEDVGLACELADRYGSRLAARDLLHAAVMLRTGAAKPLPRIKTLTSCRRGRIGRLDPADVGVWRREAESEPGPQRHAKLPLVWRCRYCCEEVMIRSWDGELLPFGLIEVQTSQAAV